MEVDSCFYTRYGPLLERELAGLDSGERDNLSVQARIGHARSQPDQFGLVYLAALADRLSGKTAALNGKVSAVDDAFAASLQQFEQLEQVIEIARTQLAWATVSLKRDPPRARSLLAAAFTAFEVAEAVPEAARVKQLWSTLG